MLVLLSLCVMGENKWRFTAKEKKVIEKAVSEIPDSTRKTFDKRYKAWKDAYMNNHEIRLSSRTESSKEVPEYKELVKMGDRIIPLLIQKMSEDIDLNFFDLVPYHHLQTNEKLKVCGMMSEQGRAYQTVLLWVKSISFP